MIEEFNKLVLSGDFSRAYEQFSIITREEAQNELLSIAMSGNILAYGFSCFLIMKETTAENHSLACLINTIACQIDGAYALAYHHAKSAAAMSKDVKFQEALLFFNITPVKYVNDDEAEKIALKVLEMEPDNKIALSIIEPK